MQVGAAGDQPRTGRAGAPRGPPQRPRPRHPRVAREPEVVVGREVEQRRRPADRGRSSRRIPLAARSVGRPAQRLEGVAHPHDLADALVDDAAQQLEVVVADRQRRHQHHDVTERADPHPASAGRLADLEAGALADRLDLDPGHRADPPDLAHAVVRREALGQLADPLADPGRVLDGAALGHQVEVRDRRPRSTAGWPCRCGRGRRCAPARARRGTPRRPPRVRAPPTAAGTRRSAPCRRSAGPASRRRGRRPTSGRCGRSRWRPRRRPSARRTRRTARARRARTRRRG